MNRLQSVKSHLTPTTGECPHAKRLMDTIENRVLQEDRQILLSQFPSPLIKSPDDILTALEFFEKADALGELDMELVRLAEEIGYGKSFVIPKMYLPKSGAPYIDLLLVLANPADLRRIGRKHLKKGVIYGSFGKGIVGTNDIPMWKEQRSHLTQAFLPGTALAGVFKTCEARAKYAIEEKLSEEAASNGEIEISEFLMYEAMAQLQVVLLGESEDYMNKTNHKIRDAFMGPYLSHNEKEKVKQDPEGYLPLAAKPASELKAVAKEKKQHGKQMWLNSVEMLERAQQGKTTPGPAMEKILTMCPFGKKRPDIQQALVSTCLFAGHDTTGSLMGHFVHAMASSPTWQKELQKEVDGMFEKVAQENRSLEYADLVSMNTLKHCINEVLRLCPSVPLGTYRTIDGEETATGMNQATGELEEASLPDGLQVLLPPILLHKNKDLWGEDALEFNPGRNWTSDEDWNGVGLKGINPESFRYCPFTVTPRDCLGKNFAQLEARLIMMHLFRNYSVELAGDTIGRDLRDISKHYGTFSPENGVNVKLTRRL